jgi:hypothetical protein
MKGAVTVHTLPALTEKLDLRVSSLGQEATLVGTSALNLLGDCLTDWLHFFRWRH